MAKCTYCQAPATRGYADLPSTLHCDNCSMIYVLHSSVADIRCSLRSEPSIEACRRAYDWECRHRKRVTVLAALRGRLRQIAPVDIHPTENGGPDHANQTR